jgi:hypothetical protein
MHMIVSIVGCSFYVFLEPGDPEFRPNRSRHSWSPPGWYGAESRLLYNVQKILNGRGYDLLKKRIWRDGHMFGGEQTQYLRSRKLKAIPSLYIYHANYALEVAAESFNVIGRARLDVVYGAGREDDPDFERECREWVRRKEAVNSCYQVLWEAEATIDECKAIRCQYRAFTDLDQARAFLESDPGESCRVIDRHLSNSSILVG